LRSKDSRAVLRGERGSNALALPDKENHKDTKSTKKNLDLCVLCVFVVFLIFPVLVASYKRSGIDDIRKAVLV
jgi:hypothetical protein